MKDKPTKLHAVLALVGGQISTSDYENLEYASGQTPPSEEAIEAKLKELMTEWDGLEEFQRDRASAFPPLQEQLDMQYWDKVNGTNKWQEAVAKVKADNPKPE